MQQAAPARRFHYEVGGSAALRDGLGHDGLGVDQMRCAVCARRPVAENLGKAGRPRLFLRPEQCLSLFRQDLFAGNDACQRRGSGNQRIDNRPTTQLREARRSGQQSGRSGRIVEHCEDHARHKSFAARRYAGGTIERFRPD
jgi:hypothetical protein